MPNISIISALIYPGAGEVPPQVLPGGGGLVPRRKKPAFPPGPTPTPSPVFEPRAPNVYVIETVGCHLRASGVASVNTAARPGAGVLRLAASGAAQVSMLHAPDSRPAATRLGGEANVAVVFTPPPIEHRPLRQEIEDELLSILLTR